MAIIRNKKSKVPCLEEIESNLAREFNYRQNIIVPNIYWGIVGIQHECDLLVLRPSGWAIEIKIKRSMADLKADKKKNHTHSSGMIRELWFAVSEKWDPNKVNKLVPKRAGIVTYSDVMEYGHIKGTYVTITKIRQPTRCQYALKWEDHERQKLLELAYMRIWAMKGKMARENLKKLEASNG